MAGMADPHLLVEGRVMSVEFGVRNDGSMPAKTYLDSLHDRDRMNLMAYVRQLADRGMINNKPNIFRRETPPFFALKRRGLNGRRIRVVLYRTDKRWILTHGFDKPAQARWEEREFTKATEIRNEQLGRERSPPR